MARQNINLGTAPGGLDGDDARTAFTKTNANFTELYGGTVLQPLNAKLSAISASVWAANQLMYTTGTGTVAMTALTAFARTLLDDADAATMRATLGALGIGDFGVGGKTIAAPSTLGSITTTGFYYCAATVTDGPIPSGTGAAQGHIIHVNHPSNGYAWQIFRSVSSPRTFERYQVAGNWGAWEERMSIGQYGVGSYAVRSLPADVEAVTIPTGFYEVQPMTTTQWPSTPFPNAWTRMLNIRHNNPTGYWSQLAFNFDVRPRMKVRGMSNGAIGEWSEVYSQISIIGTVGQAGGVPTGAIIERGSTGNGEYTKYADGTLECFQDVEAVYNTTSLLLAPSWQFPHAFVGSLPKITATSHQPAAADINPASNADLSAPVVASTSLTATSPRIWRQAGSTANFPITAKVKISLRAVGRWY